MKKLFKTRTTLFIASIAISVIGFQACKKETLPKNTENEKYFAEPWICKGIFNDLMDGGNSSALPNTESVDKISGRTIKHMYDLFGPNVINVQDYKAAYVNVFGNAADFQDIAILNGVTP